MAKKKNSATDAALQWHCGIVTEPPSDRVGKEYLVQHFSKKYRLEGDILVRYFASQIFGSRTKLCLGHREDRATSGAQRDSCKPKKG